MRISEVVWSSSSPKKNTALLIDRRKRSVEEEIFYFSLFDIRNPNRCCKISEVEYIETMIRQV